MEQYLWSPLEPFLNLIYYLSTQRHCADLLKKIDQTESHDIQLLVNQANKAMILRFHLTNNTILIHDETIP